MKRVRIALLSAGLVLAGTLVGCDRGKERRSTVAFHIQGVRQAVANLRREVPLRSKYGMEAAADQMSRAVQGLPARVRDRAQNRKEERVALAEQIRADFARLQPALEGLKYKEADATAALDQIAAKLDELEKP